MTDATRPDAAHQDDAPDEHPAHLEVDPPTQPAAAAGVLRAAADGQNDNGVLHGVSPTASRPLAPWADRMGEFIVKTHAAIGHAEKVLDGTPGGLANPDQLLRVQRQLARLSWYTATHRATAPEMIAAGAGPSTLKQELRDLDDRLNDVQDRLTDRITRWITDAWLNLGGL